MAITAAQNRAPNLDAPNTSKRALGLLLPWAVRRQKLRVAFYFLIRPNPSASSWYFCTCSLT